MQERCNLATEERGNLVLQKLFHGTYDQIIFSKMSEPSRLVQ